MQGNFCLINNLCRIYVFDWFFVCFDWALYLTIFSNLLSLITIILSIAPWSCGEQSIDCDWSLVEVNAVESNYRVSGIFLQFPSQCSSSFSAQRRARNARDTRVTSDETQGTMGMRKMRGEDVSPVLSTPPSFARKFSVRERRLGTRQNQKHINASFYKTTSLAVTPSCPHAHSCYPDVLRVHPLYQCTTLILSVELLERKVSL